MYTFAGHASAPWGFRSGDLSRHVFRPRSLFFSCETMENESMFFFYLIFFSSHFYIVGGILGLMFFGNIGFGRNLRKSTLGARQDAPGFWNSRLSIVPWHRFCFFFLVWSWRMLVVFLIDLCCWKNYGVRMSNMLWSFFFDVVYRNFVSKVGFFDFVSVFVCMCLFLCLKNFFCLCRSRFECHCFCIIFMSSLHSDIALVFYQGPRKINPSFVDTLLCFQANCFLFFSCSSYISRELYYFFSE